MAMWILATARLPGLDPARDFVEIAATSEGPCQAEAVTTSRPRRILWQNVSTVLSAAILIGAEVFGAAFAGGWALANLFGLGDLRRVCAARRCSSLGGVAVMVAFVRNAHAHRAVRRATRLSALARATANMYASANLSLQRCDARQKFRARAKISCTARQITYLRNCPISHVPVAVCRSVGIRTRGRTAARSEIGRSQGLRSLAAPNTRPAAGGETGEPRSQRGTRLKATTERAFLVSAGLPPPARVTEEACSSLPAVRIGISPIQSKAARSGLRVLAVGASPSRAGGELATRITPGGSPPLEPVGRAP